MKRQSTSLLASAPIVFALLVAVLLLPATAFAADGLQSGTAQKLVS